MAYSLARTIALLLCGKASRRPLAAQEAWFFLHCMKKSSHSRASSRSAARAGALPHRVRIIAGKWRGSRLDFPQSDAIRPTPDRVRETLFNWLSDQVRGAHCLDLFAGSGALGFEALSRGADAVVFVERDPRIVRYLRGTLERFECERGAVVLADAWRYLAGRARPFDLVFLDPPFNDHWAERACRELAQGGWLAPRALVYLETSLDESPPDLPPGWSLARHGRAGQVGYHLARAPAPDPPRAANAQRA